MFPMYVRFTFTASMEQRNWIPSAIHKAFTKVRSSFTKGRVDSIFDTSNGAIIEDPGFKRRIIIEKEHSASTIVWNPAESKAADMHHEDWKHFVCVEIGNVHAAMHYFFARDNLTGCP